MASSSDKLDFMNSDAKRLLRIASLATLVTAFLSNPLCFGSDQVVLRFYKDPQVSGSVVHLKDVVEVVSGSVPSFDKLKEMSLGPAPRQGQVQTWHSSDVLQHLELRGIHSKSIRWMGSERTQLTGVKAMSPELQESIVPAFVDDRLIVAAKNNVAAAIKEYLNLKTRSQVDWRIAPEILPQHAKLLQSRRALQSIGGGSEPWTGEQEFTLQVKVNNQVSKVVVIAQVNTPPMIVVAKGPLRRDALLTAKDLEYAPLPKNVDESKHFTDIKDLVGKQLRRSLSTHQPLNEDVLGEPIVIERNQLIEVEAVSGPVVVKTSGKSLTSGSIGDLIEIEMQERKKLKAVVVGTGRARIAAVSAVASSR
jgi:flagella basal body P-ring formation protein FlgA